MNYYLGVDIGTTSSKAVAFSETGEVISSFSFSYKMYHPQPGYSEQDPDEILTAVINGINKILETLLPATPLLISFSAAMHSIMAVDAKGGLLTKSIIWADNRASEIATALKSKEGKWLYTLSGVPVHAMSPLTKLLWLKQYEPAIFNKAEKFVGIKEYIFYRLFGEWVIDTSVASATGLLNITSLQWDEEILKFLEITSSKLSAVVSTSQSFFYHGRCSDLTLPPTVPIVIGASDGALSNLGTGATEPTTMAVTIGTSGAVRMVTNKVVVDPQMRTFCYHLNNDNYIIGGATNNGAVVLQWLKETVLETKESFDELYSEAALIAAGSEGLLLLPFILGERAPLWNASAKGVYFGLTIDHAKGHLLRSAMEGVVYSLYSIAAVLKEHSEVKEIHASGGFAKSKLWLQILADIFSVKVLVSDAVESAALGAVIIGKQALKIGDRFTNRSPVIYQPDPKNKEVYKNGFQKYQRLYDLLKEEMH